MSNKFTTRVLPFIVGVGASGVAANYMINYCAKKCISTYNLECHYTKTRGGYWDEKTFHHISIGRPYQIQDSTTSKRLSKYLGSIRTTENKEEWISIKHQYNVDPFISSLQIYYQFKTKFCFQSPETIYNQFKKWENKPEEQKEESK